MKYKILFLFVSVFFFSCSTNKFYLPGEKNTEIKNICVEYFNIAEEYFNQKNYSKAINYYKLAMKDDSLYNASYYKLGKCYALNKEYDKSLEIFENINKNDKDNTSINATIAYLYAMSGNAKKAAEIYNSILKENSDSEEVIVNYISVLIYLEDYETAKLNLKLLEEKFPKNENISIFNSKIEENTKSVVNSDASN